MGKISEFRKRLGEWMEQPIGSHFKIKLFPRNLYNSQCRSFGPFVLKSEHNERLKNVNEQGRRNLIEHKKKEEMMQKDMSKVFDKFSRIRIDQYNRSDIICCTAEVTKMMLENIRPGEDRYIDYMGEDLKRKIVRELKHYLHTREVHRVEETKYRYVTPDFGGRDDIYHD